MRSGAHPRLRAAAVLLAAAAVAAVGVRALLAVPALAAQPCNSNDRFPGWLIVASSLAVFYAGHRLAEVRRRPPPGAAPDPADRTWSRRLLHLALTAFLLLLLLALAYETVSLWNPWGLRPITSYVRCAKTIDPWGTLAVTGAISFLAGHWLWTPEVTG